MRKIIQDFVALCTNTLTLSPPIYDFGSLQVPEQEKEADLRPLFPGAKYIGCDLRPGPGVDRILDLHHLQLPDSSAQTALCLDTFEHVEYPRKAISELHRILSPGGVLILTSVLRFEIHPHPHDYWRFTPEGFASLLKNFTHSFIQPIGKIHFPHTIVAIAWKMSPTLALTDLVNLKFKEFQKSCPD
jgi:SAM-dependent methyltransferase